MAKKTIKAQMKQRRDTKANWAATNPVLLDGELGIVSDDPNLYKVGDGATAWNSLPFRGFDGTLAQELGTSPNAVISQKVVSEKLTELEKELLPLIGLHKEGGVSFTAPGIKTVIEDIYIPEGQEYQVTIGGTANWSSLYLFDQKVFAESDNAKNIPSAGTYTFAAKANEITKLQLFLVEATSFGNITVSVNVGGGLDSKVNVSDFEDFKKSSFDASFAQQLADAKSIAKASFKENETDIKAALTNGFYNQYGQFVNNTDFGNQEIIIDHSKCYYIKNATEGFAIANLVLFDASNNVIYVDNSEIVDDLFIFPISVYKVAVNRYVNTWHNTSITMFDTAANTRETIVNGTKSVSSTLFSEGEELVLSGIPNVQKNKTISFHARLGNFDNVVIRHGAAGAYANGIIKVDHNNVYFYASVGSDSVPIETRPHGLALNSFINIIIDVKEWFEGKVTITTLGGEFSTSFNTFMGSSDNITAKMGEGTIYFAQLNFGCVDFYKKVWMFGDSYFVMWPYYAINRKHSNFYQDAFAGRKSEDALVSLKNALSFGFTPKTIVWFMGMNDPDTSSVNSDWKASYDELVKICQVNNIELILTTIPNTPTMNHQFKNNIVINSGFRFVDINMAVGADVSTEWYNGLLSSDNVHPTNTYSTDGLNGCVVIAARVMADLPEIMNP